MPRFILLLTLLCLVITGAHAADKPNIVYVLADDLGYGDLSCYGQSTLATPNLDKMASEGMRFTRHYAGSTVCAPSRCVLLTGKHIGHASVRGNQGGLILDEEVTIAEMLRDAGYATGCVGKWGVGNPPPLDDPQAKRVRLFLRLREHVSCSQLLSRVHCPQRPNVKLRKCVGREMESSRNSRDAKDVAWPKRKSTMCPTWSRPKLSASSSGTSREPFFLYYALNVPHANNEGGQDGMEVPTFGEFATRDWPQPEKGFASMIRNIDRDMGRLFAKLKELGIWTRTRLSFSPATTGPTRKADTRCRSSIPMATYWG